MEQLPGSPVPFLPVRYPLHSDYIASRQLFSASQGLHVGVCVHVSACACVFGSLRTHAGDSGRRPMNLCPATHFLHRESSIIGKRTMVFAKEMMEELVGLVLGGRDGHSVRHSGITSYYGLFPLMVNLPRHMPSSEEMLS